MISSCHSAQFDRKSQCFSDVMQRNSNLIDPAVKAGDEGLCRLEQVTVSERIDIYKTSLSPECYEKMWYFSPAVNAAV